MSLKIVGIIGKGKFGTIYKVKNEKGKELVFKSVPSDKLKYIELDILTRLNSPYLIKCTEPFVTSIENKKGFTQELKENNLNQLNIRVIPYIQFKRIILSCIYGLQCMHSKNFLHLDISRKNILFDIDRRGQYTAYIADFGWSVRCTDPYQGIVSSKVVKYKNTPYEILQQVSKHEKNKHYNDKSDIWSLGIVFLELLGANFVMYDINDYLRKLKTIDEDFISGKLKLYNQGNKCSKQEELYLRELLVNMLKLDPDERISSKDFNKLQFVARDSKMNKKCVIDKPKELVVLPYISNSTRQGIMMIKNRYQTASNKIKIEEYFLAVQNFLRLMAKSKNNMTEDELYDVVVSSIKISYNYYDHTYKGDYTIAQDLNSELGFNFFYCAAYLEDLIILNHYLISGNEDLLAYYNILDINKVFEYFREKYVYKYLPKTEEKLKTFFDLDLPVKRDNEEVNFISAVDFYNYESVKKLEKDKSALLRHKSVEQSFRTDIIEHLEPKLIDHYRRTSQDLTEEVDKIIEKGETKELDELSIFKKLKGINDYFMYDIINVSMMGDIKTIGAGDLEYVIVKYENKYSLIHIDFEKRLATHYYSDLIKPIKEYYKLKDIDYVNNFDYGVTDCCKILELCLIYIIYYNLKKDVEDFSIKCLDTKTVKLVLLAMLTV